MPPTPLKKGGEEKYTPARKGIYQGVIGMKLKKLTGKDGIGLTVEKSEIALTSSNELK